MTDQIAARIAVALERIADVVELLAAPQESAPVGCQHPADDRVDFGVTDGREDWLCGTCGFRSVSEQVPA